MAEVGIIWADDADLKALYNYVESQRPNIPQYPTLQAQIESFEKWYQALTYYDVHIMINDTIAEAARRRDLVNAAMNQQIDPSWIPADKLDRTPGSASQLPGAKPPLIPSQYKVAATIGGAAIAVLIILKKLYII
jgi:hypothetical protein